MRFTLKDNLPFVSVTLAYRGTVITVPQVLIDTGSARTIFAFDIVSAIRIVPAPEDILYAIRGVGGMETVFSRTVDYIQVGERQLPQFEIEVDGMDYGFDIQGILGMDFLRQSRAVLNVAELSLEFV
jgi:hypothetical protein